MDTLNKTLIINGINWLDPWFIGQKVWLATKTERDEMLGEFKGCHSDPNFGYAPFIGEDYRDGLAGYYEGCRLAQGDKTPYDGNGESPVPDGVMVTVWGSYTLPDNNDILPFKTTGLANEMTWIDVTHYQVQEQKLELSDAEKLAKNYDIKGDGVAEINKEGVKAAGEVLKQKLEAEPNNHFNLGRQDLVIPIERVLVPVELIVRIEVMLHKGKFAQEKLVFARGGEVDGEYESILKELNK